MSTHSKKRPSLLTALAFGTALATAGAAWAQEPVTPLVGPDLVPIECIDPATGAVVLTPENYGKRSSDPLLSWVL
jgi:ABC-type enterobactin transport system permease subunit